MATPVTMPTMPTIFVAFALSPRAVSTYATATMALTPSMMSSTEIPLNENTFAAAAMMLAGCARCATDAHPPHHQQHKRADRRGNASFLGQAQHPGQADKRKQRPTRSREQTENDQRPLDRHGSQPLSSRETPHEAARRAREKRPAGVPVADIHTSSFHAAVFGDSRYTVAGFALPGSGRWCTASGEAAATAFATSLDGSSKSP